MHLKEILNQRLETLGMSRYELAKAIAENRNPPKKASSLTSTITLILDEPEGRRYSNIEEAVQAMGGEIVIRWGDESGEMRPAYPDLRLKVWELEQRLDGLQQQVEELRSRE
jgi:hypothetical protein